MNVKENPDVRVSSIALVMLNAAHEVGATDEETFAASEQIVAVHKMVGRSAAPSNVIPLRPLACV